MRNNVLPKTGCFLCICITSEVGVMEPYIGRNPYRSYVSMSSVGNGSHLCKILGVTWGLLTPIMVWDICTTKRICMCRYYFKLNI